MEFEIQTLSLPSMETPQAPFMLLPASKGPRTVPSGRIIDTSPPGYLLADVPQIDPRLGRALIVRHRTFETLNLRFELFLDECQFLHRARVADGVGDPGIALAVDGNARAGCIRPQTPRRCLGRWPESGSRCWSRYW